MGGQAVSSTVRNSEPGRLSGRVRSWVTHSPTEGPNFGWPPRIVAWETQRRLRANKDICTGRGRRKVPSSFLYPVWAARTPAGWAWATTTAHALGHPWTRASSPARADRPWPRRTEATLPRSLSIATRHAGHQHAARHGSRQRYASYPISRFSQKKNSPISMRFRSWRQENHVPVRAQVQTCIQNVDNHVELSMYCGLTSV